MRRQKSGAARAALKVMGLTARLAPGFSDDQRPPRLSTPDAEAAERAVAGIPAPAPRGARGRTDERALPVWAAVGDPCL